MREAVAHHGDKHALHTLSARVVEPSPRTWACALLVLLALTLNQVQGWQVLHTHLCEPLQLWDVDATLQAHDRLQVWQREYGRRRGALWSGLAFRHCEF